MSQKPFVLVTGGTGFLGSHIVLQLLDAGYRVRCTARSLKARFLAEAHSARGGQLEVVEIKDLASANLREALSDIDAIIHSAFPAPESMDSMDLLVNAVKCTTNTLRQGYECGVRKFVCTSSYKAMIGEGPDSVWEDYTFTDRDWNTATYDAAFDGTKDPTWIYAAAKKLSEKAAWDFAREHEGVDLATVVPTVLLGPFAPGHAILSVGDLSTNVLLRSLITPGPPPHPVWPYFVDVRDAAAAHIQALEAPPCTSVTSTATNIHDHPSSPPHGVDFASLSISNSSSSPFPAFPASPRQHHDSPRSSSFSPINSAPSSAQSMPIKRFIISGASFTWPEAISHLRIARPDLAMRGQLADASLCMSLPANVAKLDTTWSGARFFASPAAAAGLKRHRDPGPGRRPPSAGPDDYPDDYQVEAKESTPPCLCDDDTFETGYWRGIDVHLRDWRETVEDAVADLENVMETLEQSVWDDLFDDDGEHSISPG